LKQEPDSRRAVNDGRQGENLPPSGGRGCQYKTGVVFLAWLSGHQSHFTMVGGLQSARSLPHLARAYELADRIGLFPDPALAESRIRNLLSVYGV